MIINGSNELLLQHISNIFNKVNEDKNILLNKLQSNAINNNLIPIIYDIGLKYELLTNLIRFITSMNNEADLHGVDFASLYLMLFTTYNLLNG